MFPNLFKLDIKEYQEDYELDDQLLFGIEESSQRVDGNSWFYFTSFLLVPQIYMLYYPFYTICYIVCIYSFW